VAVHDADRVQDRERDRRADEREPPRSKSLRQLRANGERREPARDVGDLGAQIEVRTGVRDRRSDLGAVAHDANVGEQAALIAGGELRHALGAKAGERFAVGRTLVQDRRPRETGLRALEDDALEEPCVGAHRPAPLAVVIGAHLRVGLGPGAGPAHVATISPS